MIRPSFLFKVHTIKKLSALFYIAFLLCVSCVQVPKRPVEPVPLPPKFSMSGTIAANNQWWLDFKDPQLNNLVEHALSNNFSLLIAKSRLKEARATAKQAGAQLIPAVDGLTKARTTKDYQTESRSNSFLLEFAASYEIDLWGRLVAIQDAAILETQATEADLRTAAISIAAEVTKTWFDILANRQQAHLLERQKEINERVLELIKLQFRVGRAGAPDVLQQQQLIESKQTELAGLRRNQQLLAHQLALLLGEMPGVYNVPEISKLPILPALPTTGIPLNLLTNRPDIKSSFLRLQAADKRLTTAIANRYPKLSISADLYSSGEQANQLFKNWFTSLAANLTGPIIDGGHRKAEVEKREAAAEQLLHKYGQITLLAISEVEDALIKEDEQYNIINSLNIRLKLAAQTIDHVAIRYRQGSEDYQRVLLALLSHQGLERNIIDARLRLANNRITLYRALGGNIQLPAENK